MILFIDNHDYRYEMENLCDIFFPLEKVEVVYESPVERFINETVVVTREEKYEDSHKLLVSLYYKGEKIRSSEKNVIDNIQQQTPIDNETAIQMGALLFNILCEYLNYRPQWGMLIGVRPIKLLRKLTEKIGQDAATDYFCNNLYVSEEKKALAVQTMLNENRILQSKAENSYSLYISIPFCPTRCSYCSFVSASVDKTRKLIPEYLEYLHKEIRLTAEIASAIGLQLDTVYIGGGTPTVLSEVQLSELISVIISSFDMATVNEFTIEAGRPDTITKEKLDIFQHYGIDRISINPQTMNDSVLRRIGRNHSSEDIRTAYAMAQSSGIRNINMDLIAGLPGDTCESFIDTVKEILDLYPQNITLHTLSLKRSSNFAQNEKNGFLKERDMAIEMHRIAGKAFSEAGYNPYYLYRQNRMVANLENVGWSRPGYENRYNVFIMDESQTIIACGAGAVTKIVNPHNQDQLERVYNFKYPYEYRDRFYEIIDRKHKIEQIYSSF